MGRSKTVVTESLDRGAALLFSLLCCLCALSVRQATHSLTHVRTCTAHPPRTPIRTHTRMQQTTPPAVALAALAVSLPCAKPHPPSHANYAASQPP